jgi:hypothetical protein
VEPFELGVALFMEATPDRLKKHQTVISVVLKEVCGLTNNTGPLVREVDLSITLSALRPAKQVTKDLGNIEMALPLPIPNSVDPRYWIGLHENWRATKRHKVEFVDCGLRLYAGDNENLRQLVRLEWVAPKLDANGQPEYAGKHAGHPHWHIDRDALTGPNDNYRTIERLTAPEANAEPEDFGEVAEVGPANDRYDPYDCTWLGQVHLPANAKWMGIKWDGRTIPGPHQNNPLNIEELESWWNGALRYLASELPG